MDSQFSVSVELTKFVPFVPLVKLASQGALALVRTLNKTGSDLVVEHDLAAIFGRLRIEEHFSRNFKTAVTVSKIHPLAAGLEIVLQAGAGPTVVHAVQQAPFFSMLVQLSILLWAHDATYLARALVKIMTDKKQGNLDDVPDENSVIGTLRCIREQTCGYLWVLEFLAVQTILIEKVGLFPHEAEMLEIDKFVFATLVEGLPMLQSLPEDRFLFINTTTGVSTIVIWVFKILGLSIEVARWDDSSSCLKKYQFGVGTPRIIFRFDQIDGLSSAVVLNRADDLIFRPSREPLENFDRLWPSLRHTLAGFGEAYWRRSLLDKPFPIITLSIFASSIAYDIITIAEEEARDKGRGRIAYKGQCFPLSQKVLEVCGLLFPSCKDASSFEEMNNGPKSHGATGEPFETKARTLLQNFILSLCFLDDIESCREAPFCLDLHHNTHCESRPQDCANAFETLGEALRAPEGFGASQRTAMSAVSGWGWTLLLHCVTTQDVSMMQPGIALVQGVPSWNGVQRRLILDWAREDLASQSKLINTNFEHSESFRLSSLKIIGQSGDEVVLDGRHGPKTKSNYLIGNGESSFIVCKQIRWPTVKDIYGEYTIRIGLRQVQEALWASLAIPSCNCKTFSAGDVYTLAPDTWAFSGLLSRTSLSKKGQIPKPLEALDSSPLLQTNMTDNTAHNQATVSNEMRDSINKKDGPTLCRIYISQTADDEDSRMLQLLTSEPNYTFLYENPQVLRPKDSCVSCAVAYLKKHAVKRYVGVTWNICLIV